MTLDCRIDHLVITSPSLEAGSQWIFERLGVRPAPGGEHPRMGTHNHLLRLGDTVYLEVIAIQPGAPAPQRPRWFDLDRLPADAPPRLACWVARTEDLPAALAAAGEDLGPAEPMSRGDLRWQISIPRDGVPALGGLAPSLIQWQAPTHPAQGLPDAGCRLEALTLVHPDPQRIETLLHRLQLAEPGVQVAVREGASPGLQAQVRTPAGLQTLGLD